ncbi:MAG: hypothetical protein ABI881_04645 [Betaproteobacteria bacterium]
MTDDRDDVPQHPLADRTLDRWLKLEREPMLKRASAPRASRPSQAPDTPSLRVKGNLPPPGHESRDWLSDRAVSVFCWVAMGAVIVVCVLLVYRGLQVFTGLR